MPIHEYLYLAMYIAIATSFMIRDVLWLRAIYSIGSVIGIYIGFVITTYTLIIFNSILLIINVIQIIRILLEQKPLLLPKELKEIYLTTFSGLTTKEFLLLFDCGKTCIIENSTIMRHGDTTDLIYVILSGQVSVCKKDKLITVLSPGAFLGEMRFLSHEPASADIKAEGKVTYQIWDRAALDKLETKYPVIYTKLQRIIGQDLVEKLRLHTTEAA